MAFSSSEDRTEGTHMRISNVSKTRKKTSCVLTYLKREKKKKVISESSLSIIIWFETPTYPKTSPAVT